SSPNELEKPPEPVRAIDQAEQEDIAEYLVCDEPLLYSLIPPYVKEMRSNMYNTRGQIADGRRFFEQLRPKLYRKLCEEWGACSKLDDSVFNDEVDLVVRIADITDHGIKN